MPASCLPFRTSRTRASTAARSCALRSNTVFTSTSRSTRAGRGERKTLRHQPAHREPGQHELPEIEPVGEAPQLLDEAVETIGPGRLGAGAVAEHVIAHDIVVRRQTLRHRLPHLQVGADSMDQHDRRARARAPIVRAITRSRAHAEPQARARAGSRRSAKAGMTSSMNRRSERFCSCIGRPKLAQ